MCVTFLTFLSHSGDCCKHRRSRIRFLTNEERACVVTLVFREPACYAGTASNSFAGEKTLVLLSMLVNCESMLPIVRWWRRVDLHHW